MRAHRPDRRVTPSALGCEECLKIVREWLHLRICRLCGHVGCRDDSPNRHATAHYRATTHPIIEGYDPPEGWGWCFVDEVMLDHTDDTTRHNGPIPRHYRATGRATARSAGRPSP
ncbi:MAG: UBP-type zinc finger domain-containing protein [Burkholderiaceae bacterium]